MKKKRILVQEIHIMTRFFYTFIFALFVVFSAHAEDCTNGRYLKPVFEKVDVTKNIKYARKKQSDGAYIELKYDIYQPQGDTMAERPVMLLIHGGAYLKLLDQNSPDIVLLCNYFAQRGYVTVSIDYRQEPNLLGLLSEETMVKAVSRALIDTKDAVDHLMLTYQNGNPYRIDTSKAIIGGVSAGAVSTMFIAYLDSLQMLPQRYQNWIIEANGDSADYILRHKFDLVKPKAAISISGAVLDTSWIRKNGIDLLLIHGSADEIVPYNYDHPFHLPMLPKLYGGKAQYPVAIREGIRCEFEDWIGRGHVPFFNLDIASILTLNLIDFDVLDSTQRHIAEFCYNIAANCDGRVTGIRENIMQEKLHIFPNPSSGNFTIQLPKQVTLGEWNMQLFDLSGRQVFARTYDYNTAQISVNETLPPGMYLLKMNYLSSLENLVYTQKLVITQ